jgi:hypothetical protein
VNFCTCRKCEWISSLLTSLQSLTQIQSCRVSIYRSSARSVSRDVLASFLLPLFLLSIPLALSSAHHLLFLFRFFSSPLLLLTSLFFLFIFPILLFQFILSFQIHFLYGYLLLIPLIRTVVCSWSDKGMMSLDSRFSVVPGGFGAVIGYVMQCEK